MSISIMSININSINVNINQQYINNNNTIANRWWLPDPLMPLSLSTYSFYHSIPFYHSTIRWWWWFIHWYHSVHWFHSTILTILIPTWYHYDTLREILFWLPMPDLMGEIGGHIPAHFCMLDPAFTLLQMPHLPWRRCLWEEPAMGGRVPTAMPMEIYLPPTGVYHPI